MADTPPIKAYLSFDEWNASFPQENSSSRVILVHLSPDFVTQHITIDNTQIKVDTIITHNDQG